MKQLEQKEYIQAKLEQRVEELREQISTASRYIISDLNSKEFKKKMSNFISDCKLMLIKRSLRNKTYVLKS